MLVGDRRRQGLQDLQRPVSVGFPLCLLLPIAETGEALADVAAVLAGAAAADRLRNEVRGRHHAVSLLLGRGGGGEQAVEVNPGLQQPADVDHRDRTSLPQTARRKTLGVGDRGDVDGGGGGLRLRRAAHRYLLSKL